MDKAQLEALQKQIGELVTAAVTGAIPTIVAQVRADDSGGQKLDKVLSAIDAFCGKMDAFEKRMDEHGKRMDADAKKDGEEISRKDGESEEDFKKRKDASEEAVAADKARKDAEEKEAKEKADAEEKAKKDAEEEERKKADAAGRSDFDRLVGATTEMAKRLKTVEAAMPRQLTDEDRHAFSAAQARADDVYSAFGKRAPYPLSGEDVLPYRRRLVASLKEHSLAWKDVDILAIADAATFKIAEDTILRDAAKAALHPADLKIGELREIVRSDSSTGVRTVEFRGMHSFVKSLTRPPRHVKSIGLRKEA